MSSYLLALAISLLPTSAITFVVLLVAYKLYIKVRSKYNVTVNCWFCNQNARIPYLEANSWTCPQCEQYNGFTKDGDYNREIYQQLDCSNLAASAALTDECSNHDIFSATSSKNGFCNACNESQRLKVEKLAQFDPKNESRFDEELKLYKAQLEEQYRLCSTCDRHLGKVLREKKKMVLGSKFLEFIIKGAEALKQPHFNQIRTVQKQKFKKSLATLITIFTGINIICLASGLPSLTKENLAVIFGESTAYYVFVGLSHVLALGQVFATYLEQVTKYAAISKVILFFKTLFMMILYSMGMKMQQIATMNMFSLYVLACPFVILCLAFMFKIVDGFKLTRFTLLLTLWSTFASGIIDQKFLFPKDILMVIASAITITLSLTGNYEAPAKVHDTSSNSFHKIYSEDYLSDEDTRDTISMLSQKLNCSNSSIISSGSNRSFMTHHNHTATQLTKSPLTSSVLSLNQLNHSQISPSFKTFCLDDSQSAARPHYASSLKNFPVSRPLFASSLELNCLDRSHSSFATANSSFIEPVPTKHNHLHQQHQHQMFNNIHYNDQNHHHQRWDENFHNSPNATFTSASNLQHYANNTQIASPFSVSSSAVYQQQQQHQRSNLLTPSRFSTNSLATNTPSASWLSGGYFNNRNDILIHQPEPKRNYFLEQRNNMSSIQENISRASSQSSGFESHSSGGIMSCPANRSRENSADIYPTIIENHVDSYHPIETMFPRPDALLNTTIQSQNGRCTPTTMQPLAVNCNQEYWKSSQNNTRDSFNLRKINDHLPPIQRGALLKKWKEGQLLSLKTAD